MISLFSKFKSIINHPGIALDLGTANTRIFSPAIGYIREKPSLIRHRTNNKNNSVSDDYLKYLNSKISFTPLRGGVIVDMDNAVNLLRPLLKETKNWFRTPVLLASAPTDTTERERRLLAETVINAGASHVAIIPEVWAAALGSGIDVTSRHAQTLIDIGEGVTDLAVIRDGRIIYSSAIRTACSDLQKGIRSFVVSKHKVYICPEEAEKLTHTIASISTDDQPPSVQITVKGNDILKGEKVTITVNEQDIISAMEPVLSRILKMIGFSLKRLSTHLLSEIMEAGICLSGGGACISGIDRLIVSKTGMHVKIAPDPIHSVINGEIETLNYWNGQRDWWQNIEWPKLPQH